MFCLGLWVYKFNAGVYTKLWLYFYNFQVFDDIAVEKIKESDLEIECELGQGGFGVVRKMKLHTVCKPG